MNFVIFILSFIPLICNAQVSNQAIINGQCTGSIIQEHWILTSASCALLHGQVTSINVNGINYGVQQVITHPNYVQNQADNDIALIKLNADVNGYQEIFLDFNEAADYRGFKISMNGPFGNGQTYKITDEAVCREQNFNTLNLICAQPIDGQQYNCQVNTGSPVIHGNRIIGLESGIYQCGSSVHVFTRISRHQAWILSQIQLYNFYQPYTG